MPHLLLVPKIYTDSLSLSTTVWPARSDIRLQSKYCSEMITDRSMVEVSLVFGKTEWKLSQQESNFWHPQTWRIDHLTNLKLFWPKQLIPKQILLVGNKLYFNTCNYYFLIKYKMCTGESTKIKPYKKLTIHDNWYHEFRWMKVFSFKYLRYKIFMKYRSYCIC